jgi:hypothetical protein
MKSPTATFFAIRKKGKNAPAVGDHHWSIFWDKTEKEVTDMGPDKYEAVRITVEPLDEEAKKTSVTDERDYWRSVAAYLASCHAATADGVLNKKTGYKYEKLRHLNIMRACISMLKGIWPERKIQSGDIELEIERCQSVLDDHPDSGDEKTIVAKIGTHPSEQVQVSSKKIVSGQCIKFKRRDGRWEDGIVTEICDWGLLIALA